MRLIFVLEVYLHNIDDTNLFEPNYLLPYLGYFNFLYVTITKCVTANLLIAN